MFGDFTIVKKCKVTNARVSEFKLDKNTLHTPIFMPVATYGAMRGVPPGMMPEEIILSNTYHLRKLGRNIKDFMGWNKSMLTDSGGFQIQSLPNVEVTDEGVIFDSKLFTPEDSMNIQMCLGADIMMQLDDVVNPNEPVGKHVKAIERSIEWLDRAINHINIKSKIKEETARNNLEAGKKTSDELETANNKLETGNELNDEIDRSSDHEKSNDVHKRIKAFPSIRNLKSFKGMKQTLFPIIQGGLIDDLRRKSIKDILLRDPIGIAIGGLSGGEDKMEFCNTVLFCCENLPENLPRYLMGVGYPEDIAVCCALGTDMSDCVYPTRTARFGRAFTDDGDIMISNKFAEDLSPLDIGCACYTCERHSKAFLNSIKGTPNFCMLMSLHNLHYMRNLTSRIRESILNECFCEFLKKYLTRRFKNEIPKWIILALEKVNVKFNE